MKSVGGMSGTVLRINLDTTKITTEATPLEQVENYLGGRGLGAYLFTQEVAPTVEPLGRENKLVFVNGPLAGSLIPGNNKVCCTFKSPLTGTYSFSLCGGHWGPELKFSGYDGVIIEGASEQPVYVWIDDDTVEIRDAAHLWGMSIPDAEEQIKEELGGDESIQVAVIGPAGERLNRMAGITAGWYREFGRGGSGAVMGSKKLKAIAIRGTRDVSFADVDGMKKLSEELCKRLRAHPKGQERRKYGTPEMVKGINNNGLLSTRNFQEGFFDEGYKLEGPQMREDIVVGDASCYGCPLGCGKRSYVKTDDYGNLLLEGPEFETIGLLGANCGVSDWGDLVRATKVCDENGFDTMNAGVCVALAMECYERGILGLEDTGGLDLHFGNGKALVKVLEQMAHREGIGDILAEGVKKAAESFGVPELAMESKGQGFAVYDPRGCKGMALTYATSPKGAHHMIATTMGPEISGGTRLSIEEKGALQRVHQFSMCIVDSIALCATTRVGIGLDDQAKGFSMVTGLEMDEDKLTRAAERIINLERMYNVKLGLSRKDDTIPKRFLNEPMPSGASEGETVDLESMLDEFYEVMGWNKDGIPTTEKLQELGLKHYL
jgi:aldehyde:ferredoxin oxidoreductase